MCRALRLALVGLALCAATSAHAGAHTVTLLGIGGTGGDRFAELVEQDLSDVYEMLPSDVYRAGAARLGMRSATPNDVRAVARSLRIDAVIGGTITGEGAQRRLQLAVRSGHTGLVVARLRYELGTATLPQVRERVVSDLVRAIERVDTAEQPSTPTVEPEEQPDVELAAARPTRGSPRGQPERPRRPGVEAGVGVTLFSRFLSFDLASAPGYRGGTVGGIHADGAVYPLALSAELAEAHPVLASFGLTGSYEHSFGFSSTGANGSIAAHASRWSALFVGRIPLGRREQGGTLTIETGIQALSWSSDSPADLGVPDVQYQLFDFGVTWERQLGTPRVHLALHAAALALARASGISSDAEYGAATGWGLETAAGLTVTPTRWLWLRLAGRYTPVVMSFAANGTRFARSASDQWVSGLLEVGFAL